MTDAPEGTEGTPLDVGPTGPGAGAPRPRRTNPLAVISLVAGLCGFSVLPLFGSVAAVVTGHLALGQIRTTGEDGLSFARAGLWLGYVALVLGVVIALLLLGFVVMRSST